MKRYYTKKDIENMLRKERPYLTRNEINYKVIEIHRALNTMDISWRRSNKKFYGMTTGDGIMAI